MEKVELTILYSPYIKEMGPTIRSIFKKLFNINRSEADNLLNAITKVEDFSFKKEFSVINYNYDIKTCNGTKNIKIFDNWRLSYIRKYFIDRDVIFKERYFTEHTLSQSLLQEWSIEKTILPKRQRVTNRQDVTNQDGIVNVIVYNNNEFSF